MTTSRDRRRLFIVSSLSGAGRTTALGVLSDLGFLASDATPVALWPALLAESGGADVAIGWPIAPADRQSGTGPNPLVSLPEDVDVTHLFLSAELETLRRRYTETRRTHPFDQGKGLVDALTAEQQASQPRRAMADQIIDTTGTKLADLRATFLSIAGADEDGLQIRTLSFSYRQGLPMDADMVIDVRWLRNPHYEPALRAKTGQERAVGDYIRQDEGFDAFEEHLRRLLEFTAERQQQEGKAYFTFAFGCTGGKHRSVFFAEQAGVWLRDAGYRVLVQHREIQQG